MIQFNISEDVFKKCSKFALDSVGTSADKYARRKQFSVNKIKLDIRNGKIGECQAHLHFIKKYPDLTTPDFNIYDKKNKNWDPDLKSNDFKLAVKSQDIQSAMDWGQSWVFQFGNGKWDCDSGIFGSGQNDDKHYVSFVSLNVPIRNGNIKAVVSVKWLKDNNMFKEMRKKSLRGNKVAVYYEDLEKHTDIWQL